MKVDQGTTVLAWSNTTFQGTDGTGSETTAELVTHGVGRTEQRNHEQEFSQ
ncbi:MULTISPECIES: hypothetical protein [Rhodococcus]|uniref:hypothetical protein n=1 Tax=Rhodococcus TaxID=1827 RepID=UPI00030C9178|nr:MULTISPECIES: hypothetical protein [Rhodococcus]QQZ18141.1 hypothetical protein GO592_00720 [Rhodococcus sp. 21391]